MFVDASAICAIALEESEADHFLHLLQSESQRTTSPLAVWESVVAIVRVRQVSPTDAFKAVRDLLDSTKVDVVAIPPEAAALAIDAYDRFGKGRHPAALNFGDCFAYACARHHRMPLLFKGNDFSLTDIELA